MEASVLGITFVMCDALVDQGRYIGDDTVGYKCTRPATKRVCICSRPIDLCDWCADNLDRVCLPFLAVSSE